MFRILGMHKLKMEPVSPVSAVSLHYSLEPCFRNSSIVLEKYSKIFIYYFYNFSNNLIFPK
jgi:hypothetical protein